MQLHGSIHYINRYPVSEMAQIMGIQDLCVASQHRVRVLDLTAHARTRALESRIKV